MGVASVVHWWEESQMRVLVIGSLVVQYLLLIFTFLRSRAIAGWIRFLMWLAYLGGDAIAIYALATLFNRHKDQDCRGKSRLEVMLAPILLLHLGGHDGISAYNIEDNELWSRHLLTAVSQVTVAIYVFCKSWPAAGDKRLLQASILLFIPGVLKCFAKPWALKRASITSLVRSPAAKRTAKKGEAGEIDPNSLEKYVKQAKAFVQEQKKMGNKAQSERACVENGDHSPPQQGKQDEDEMIKEYVVEGESDFVVGEEKDEGGAAQAERDRILRGDETYKLFVDLSSPYAGCRLSIFKYFWALPLSNQEKAETATTRKSQEETAYGYVRRGLSGAFLLLYTRLKTSATPLETDYESPASAIGYICRFLIWFSRGVLPLAAIVLISLFRVSHRQDTDAKTTFLIVCLTSCLEVYSSYPLVFVGMDVGTCRNPLLRRVANAITGEHWPETVAQYSLAGYLARNKNCGKVMWVASKLGCRDLVDRHWCMKPCSSSSRGITELVLGYLRDGWEEKIQDVASYHSFIDSRGHWALEGKGNEGLRWSIKEPFDESVLLWHIATDFCFFSSPLSEHECGDATLAQKARSTCGELTACRAVQCRQMSNYMVYLLFVNPEMLLPGTRRNLFTTAYHELKDILRGNNLNPESCCCHCQQVVEKGLLKTLIKTMSDRSKKQDPEIGSQEESKQGQPKGGCNGNFIDDAWDLAQGLLKVMDDSGEEKMWEVIQGVWVEMLCFSASRCRGYLHAKALASGGEFLSYIWLLLFYMGMETFSERLQREKEELPSREANNNAAPPASGDLHKGSGTGSSSVSRIHTGASTSDSDEIQMANNV